MILTLELGITLLIAVACVSVELFIAFKLSKRWINYKAKTLAIFIIALTSLLLADGTGLIAMLITDETTLVSLYKFSLIASMISVCMLLFFFEAFEYDTIFTWKQMIHTLLLGGTLAAILLGDFETVFHPNIELFSVSVDPLTDILILILPGLGSLLIIVSLWGGYREVWAFQRRQLRIMVIGIVIAYLIPILLRPVSIALSSMIFTIFLRADVAIGFILYFVSFGGSENFSVFNRHRAERLLVISDSGLPIFSYDFKADDDQMDKTLFAGGIVAITSLFQEATQSTNVISEVKMENNHVVLEKKEEFFALILTPHITVYLKEALKRFINAFDRKFGDKLSTEDFIQPESFQGVGKKLIYESFGVQT
ncbi:MAG: hypothetical protein ACXAB2_03760 [Candidatus Hodarchaeales archaeon]|jgi:hypothetical protein